jgi:hypothetical protein
LAIAEEMYDEHGRVRTERELSPPVERPYGKWMAITAGILILIPAVLVTLDSMLALALGASNMAGFGFFLFVLGWLTLFFGIGGLIGGVCAIRRTRGSLAVIGAVLMMFVAPFLAAPALLLIYLARDEF